MPKWDQWMLGTSHSVYAAMPLSFSASWYMQYKGEKKLINENSIKSGCAIGIALGIATALKYTIKRPRPFTAYPNLIVQRDFSVGPNAFPSGHTTAAFASATVWSLSANKWYVTAMAYSYASLVGYSRMRLGVHYPSDVLAGAVIGMGSGYLSWYVVKRVYKWRNNQQSKTIPPSS